MALAVSGHEREQRRRAVEKAAAQILAALDWSVPSLTCKLAQAAIQQFPNEGALLQLRARAERQVGHQAGECCTLRAPCSSKDAKCLACHDTPDRTLVERYGNANGFGWKLNDILTAQIVSAPMELPNGAGQA
jgi:Protein of unknown function (DUF3365)